MLECIKGNNTVWTSEISYDAFFCCSLGTSYSHAHARTVAHAQTLWLSSHYVRVLAKGDTRSVRTPSGSASAIACLYGSHSGWIHRERERASRMNTQFPFYRNCLFRANNHSSVDQRFSKSVSYTDTSSTVLYFYPLSSTETLSGYLCQSTAHDDDNDDDINDTFYRYFNHARSTNKQQQQHFHTTIKFIKYSWFRYCYTVCDRIITVPVFRFFIFSFVIVYCLSRYFTPFVCVCAVADWQFLCTHTHTHYTQQKSWYESVSIVILLEIIFIVYSLLSCSVLFCTMCNFYLVLNLYPLFCFVLFEFIYDLVWSNLSTCCFPFHLLFPIASVHLFETQLAIDDLSQ